MSVCANISVKLERKMFNRKHLSKQDKLFVNAKVQKFICTQIALLLSTVIICPKIALKKLV